jgi:hypothetical protein
MMNNNYEALTKHLDTLIITSDNIGVVRSRLMMPFDCEWNGAVRDMTAARENKAALDSGGGEPGVKPLKQAEARPCVNAIIAHIQKRAANRAAQFTAYGHALQTVRNALPISLTPEVEEALALVIDGMPH